MLTDRDIAKEYLKTIPTLTERERSEALFALIYHVDPDLHHGTSGHIAYDTIAKLVQENFRLHYILASAGVPDQTPEEVLQRIIESVNPRS